MEVSQKICNTKPQANSTLIVYSIRAPPSGPSRGPLNRAADSSTLFVLSCGIMDSSVSVQPFHEKLLSSQGCSFFTWIYTCFLLLQFTEVPALNTHLMRGARTWNKMVWNRFSPQTSIWGFCSNFSNQRWKLFCIPTILPYFMDSRPIGVFPIPFPTKLGPFCLMPPCTQHGINYPDT